MDKIELKPKTEGVFQKFFWVVTHRPNQVWKMGRGYLLFEWSRLWRPIVLGQSDQIRLGRNVRIQRNFSLSAERPHGRISIGDHSILYENAQVESYGLGRVDIGPCCILGDTRIYSRATVRLGARVVSSWNVLIQDFDSHPIDPDERALQIESLCARFRPGQWESEQGVFPRDSNWSFPGRAIEIGDDVWIGANSTILKGARVGRGCLIAAGAVLPGGEYPPRSLIAGNPARVVKSL